jgi:hypothetical protein
LMGFSPTLRAAGTSPPASLPRCPMVCRADEMDGDAHKERGG